MCFSSASKKKKKKKEPLGLSSRWDRLHCWNVLFALGECASCHALFAFRGLSSQSAVTPRQHHCIAGSVRMGSGAQQSPEHHLRVLGFSDSRPPALAMVGMRRGLPSDSLLFFSPFPPSPSHQRALQIRAHGEGLGHGLRQCLGNEQRAGVQLVCRQR